MSDDATPVECDSCGFKDPVGGVRPFTDGMPPFTLSLCRVCSGTPAGNSAFWPRVYDNAILMKMVAWGVNRLRRDLADLVTPPRPGSPT